MLPTHVRKGLDNCRDLNQTECPKNEITEYANVAEYKDPGTFTGTISQDVTPITTSSALTAVRLCNFPTNLAAPLESHTRWIDMTLVPRIQSLTTAWIDLIGYASLLGYSSGNSAHRNYELSNHRCAKVREYIQDSTSKAKFHIQWPKGASESGSHLNTNNDGYWRAVEVYLYGFKPPTVGQVFGSKRFKIRCVGSAAYGASKYGGGASLGGSLFEIVDKTTMESVLFRHVDASMTLSLPIGPNVSFSDAGPWTHFETTQPVELYDFQGTATIYQSPGAQVGSWSIGGTLYLSIDSDKLLELAARITPKQMLEITTGDGYSGAGLSVGIPWSFNMVGTTKPYRGD